MIEVELPDGRIAEFPENMSQEEIQNVLRQQIPQPDISYLEQITEGSPQRRREMQRISSQYESGQITSPEYVLQNLGEAAGNIGDVAGRAIGDVASGAYGLLPESAQQNIEQAVAPIGRAVMPAIEQAGQYYGSLKEKYPRQMENVEAATNVGLLAAPALGRAKQIQGGVSRGGSALAQKVLPDPKTLSSEEIKKTASRLFKRADEKGGVLKTDVTNQFVDDVLDEIPQTDLGKAVIGENPVSKLTERIEFLRNRPMTLQAAQEIDEALGDLAYGSMNPVTGQIDKQGLKFLNVQSKFRNAIENAPEELVVGGKEGFDALKDARKYWATSLRLADVEKAIQKGLGTEQPQTGIKNAFKTLLNSKKIRNYSPSEVQAIKQAAQKGVLTDVLGTFGSRLNPQLTGIGVGLAAQDTSMGVLAFGAQAVGAGVARNAATKLQLARAKQVENLIRQRIGDTSGQKFALTPEIKLLAKEAGIVSMPSGGVQALLEELQNIQQTGTVPSEEK